MKQNNSCVDPSALGLFGLAIVTLVASSQKLGLTSGLSFVIPWALMLGASCQLMAGILDAKKNNVFGMTAFSAYAFFWFAVAFSWLVSLGVFGKEMQLAADSKQLGIAFVGYLIFTIFMTIGSFRTNKTLIIIFIAIDFLFIGLSLSSFNIMPEISGLIAAYSELVISLVSFYGFGALIINSSYGKEVLPLGAAIS